jgi:hypothetical protein
MAARRGRGGKRPGAGRPLSKPEERQRNRVTMNLTDAEYQALLDAADGEIPGTFAREVLARFLARRRK